MINQSIRDNGTVLKTGCKKGTYTTASCSASEENTAITSHLLANGPTLNREYFSERAANALHNSNVTIRQNIKVLA